MFSFQALGCLLYMLCYMEHPFEDGAKLRILNAKFTLPEFDKEYDVFHSLICTYFVFNFLDLKS